MLLRCYPLCLHQLSTSLCYNNEDVRGVSTKILLGFLAVTLVAPTVFFSRPQKAEALLSLAQCIVAKVTALAVAAGPIAGQAALAVMTISPAEAAIAAQAPAGQDWVSCFMKGLVKIIAKTLLHTFVQSIVNWINSGFQGSPSFITNPEGFIADVADQTIGRVIENISPLLCSPFRLDIRLALGLNISLNTEDEIHCRLSDVIANVRGAYDGFVTGTIGSGNLSRWIHIAGTPQNNPYGAYIATTNRLSASIVTAQGQQIKLLDWGKGFRSWRSCEKWGPDIKTKSGATRKGPCIKEGPIKTPGSIIQDQTSGALGTTFRELELANEIDEIVGALINQLLVKAITGVGGLLGASKGSITSGGQSAADELATNAERALAIANVAPPEGINCSLRYYPAMKETTTGSEIYVPDDTLDTVYTNNLGVETVGVRVGDLRAYVEAKYKLVNGTEVNVEKKTGQTWRAYFEQVQLGCSNRFSSIITSSSKASRTQYENEITVPPCSSRAIENSAGVWEENEKVCVKPQEPPALPKFPTLEQRWISLWDAEFNQSRVYSSGGAQYGPRNAAGGFSISDTYGGAQHWWTASLKKTERIKIIMVRTYNDAMSFAPESIELALLPPPTNEVPIVPENIVGNVVFSIVRPAGRPRSEYELSPNSNATVTFWPANVTIEFTTPVEANAIVIKSNSRLMLTSVRLYRPVEEANIPSTTPPPLSPPPEPGLPPGL